MPIQGATSVIGSAILQGLAPGIRLARSGPELANESSHNICLEGLFVIGICMIVIDRFCQSLLRERNESLSLDSVIYAISSCQSHFVNRCVSVYRPCRQLFVFAVVNVRSITPPRVVHDR